MNVLDLDLRCLDKYFPFAVHWLHVGFDCSTFSYLALEESHRKIENHFMGTSSKAWRANSWLQHTMALIYLVSREI